MGVTKPAIRRLARRVGVMRTPSLTHVKTRLVLRTIIEKVIRDSVTYTEHSENNVSDVDMASNDTKA